MFTDSQRSVSRHGSVAAHPRRKRFTWEPFRDVNIIVTLSPKIQDLGDVGVPQLLRHRHIILKLLPLGRIDALCWDQRYRNRLCRPLIRRFVADCRAVAIRFKRTAIIHKADAVILEECRTVHNGHCWPRRNYDLAARTVIQP